ncbi:aminotransferase class V-fold PLP-dependent enzyme [Paraburkholderia caribensis]|uniref:aminotransferase class V-fold PLP-dependent enzyme n=1 Tax=Paraburkholderia caribensis TaxID=75105 RepID=UPI00071FBA33|nr:aminotransferase class V-fold PLP-dependent enzyme [Paraburkholderia caribensis]ALP68545.1 aminotransferase class V [Paraburkholderia caribensis]AUT57902.1 aminotransferase class V-fold PLP-dependent enzyme [Paraburkholderia caribensis]
MSIDVDRLRADTPGVMHCLHFNNAGAGLMPAPVLDAMTSHLRREAEIGGYEAGFEASAALDAVYDSVAALIGARRDEIALTENATVAWQMAFYSLRFEQGDRILTAQAEYAANFVAFLHMARRTGAVVEVVPNNEDGVLDTDALETMIDERVKLIAITWVPTNGGLVNPVAEVGRIARSRGVRYLVDACQAVGQMPVDVIEIGCDMLSATGRKFLRGPRGTGFLYVRRQILGELHPPVIDHFAAPWIEPQRYDLRDDARRFETWENNYAARLGLKVAVDYAMAVGLDAIRARCLALSAELRAALTAIPGVRLHDLGTDLAAIVSFTIDNRDPLAVNRRLFEARINVTTSRPAVTLLDSLARELPTLLRASPHYYNTSTEVEAFAKAIRQITSD